jgi:hypothetical protein
MKEEKAYRGRNFVEYRRWEPGETDTLIRLVGKVPTIDICKQIGRTRDQAQHKLKRMGMSAVKIKYQTGLHMIKCLEDQGYTSEQIKFVLGESVERYL